MMKTLALFLMCLLLPIAVRAEFNYLTYNLDDGTVTPLETAPTDVKSTDYRDSTMLFVQDPTISEDYYMSVFEVTQAQAKALGWGTTSTYEAYGTTAWGINHTLEASSFLSFPTSEQWSAYAAGAVKQFCNVRTGIGTGFNSVSLEEWYTTYNSNANYTANNHGVFDIYGNAAEYIADTGKFNGGFADSSCNFSSVTTYNGKSATEIPQPNGKGLLGARLVYTPPTLYTVVVTKDGEELLHDTFMKGEMVELPPQDQEEYVIERIVTPASLEIREDATFIMPDEDVTITYTTTKAYVTVYLNGEKQDGRTAYAAGEQVSFVVPTVAEGIYLSEPSITPETIALNGTTFTMPTPCVPVTIHYTSSPTVIVTLDGNVQGTPIPYPSGTTVSFTPPTPANGYALSSPSITPGTVIVNNTTFTMPDTPVTIAYTSIPCVLVTLDGEQRTKQPFTPGTTVDATLAKPTLAENLLLLGPTYTPEVNVQRNQFIMPSEPVTIAYQTGATVTITLNGHLISERPAVVNATVLFSAPTATDVGAGFQLSTPIISPTPTHLELTQDGGSFTMPKAPVTITYTKRPILTVMLDGTTTFTQAFDANTTATFTLPTVKTGYTLSTPKRSPSVTMLTENSFMMPNEPVTLSYTSLPYLTITLDGTIVSNEAFTPGESTSFRTPTVKEGYELSEPTVPAGVILNGNRLTMPSTPTTIAYKSLPIVTVTLDGRTSSTQAFEAGKTATFTKPTVDTGYKLSMPTVTPSSVQLNGTSFTMPNVPVTIAYTSRPFLKIVVVNGTTSATEVLEGERFTITANTRSVPEVFTEWTLSGTTWRGEIPTTATATLAVPTTFTAGGTVTFTATYDVYPRIIVEGGTARVISGQALGNNYYTVGTQLVLEPSEQAFQRFTGWKKEGISYSGNTVTVGQLGTSVTFTATYAAQPRVLVYGGTVTTMPLTANLGNGYYSEGATLTLTAPQTLALNEEDATAQKVFSHWERNGTSVVANPLTITITGSETTTYTAIYTGNTGELPSRITTIGEDATGTASRTSFGYTTQTPTTYGNTSKGNAFVYYGATLPVGDYAIFDLGDLKTVTYPSEITNSDEYKGQKLALKRIQYSNESPFYLGVYETSVAHYEKLMNNATSNNYLSYKYKSWKTSRDAQNFVSKLSSTFSAHDFIAALPTTTQIETVTRAGLTSGASYSGAGYPDGRGYGDSRITSEMVVAGTTGYASIGSKTVDPYGFYDLWGNVAELYSDVNEIRGGDAGSTLTTCSLKYGTSNDTFFATFRPAITLKQQYEVTITDTGINIPAKLKVIEGQTIYLQPLVHNTKVFAGWKANGTTISPNNGSYPYTVNSNVTLTPIWRTLVQSVTLNGSGWTGPSTIVPGQTTRIYFTPGMQVKTLTCTNDALSTKVKLVNNNDGTATLTTNAYDTVKTITIQVTYRNANDPLYTYISNNTEIMITGYPEPIATLTLPSTIDGLPVTAIGDSAFANNKVLTSVTLPQTIKTIGKSAFTGCTKLITINFPNTLTTIRQHAFSNTGINGHITLPASLTTLEYAAFYRCKSLQLLTLSNCMKLTTLGDAAFRECSNLTALSLPRSLTTIGARAFMACPKLNRVTINQTASQLTTIGEEAFSGCSSLVTMTFPNKLTTIKAKAFYTSGLNTLYAMPATLTTIGTSAFAKCPKLPSMTLSTCTKLTTLGDDAFRECPVFTATSLPRSMKTIGARAFMACPKLVRVTINKENSQLVTIGDEAFMNCSSLTNFTFPNQLQTIRPKAFYASGLNTLYVMPATLTTLASYAFAKCPNLPSMTLKTCTKLTRIGDEAFSQCPKFTAISLPDSLTTICPKAFYQNTKLNRVTIVSSASKLSIIGAHAFYGCKALKSFDFAKTKVLKHIRPYAFAGSVLTGQITLPASLETLEKAAFYRCLNLKLVTLSSCGKLVALGEAAFRECTSLEAISLPRSLKTIGSRAFYGCAKLNRVTIHATLANLTTIGDSAFYNCKALKTFSMPSTVRTVQANAFAGCTTTITLNGPRPTTGTNAFPSTVTVIAKTTAYPQPFTYEVVEGTVMITGLVDTDTVGAIEIPERINGKPVAVIACDAFRGCYGLETVTIPATVMAIGDGAFVDCGVDTLIFEGLPPEIVYSDDGYNLGIIADGAVVIRN